MIHPSEEFLLKQLRSHTKNAAYHSVDLNRVAQTLCVWFSKFDEVNGLWIARNFTSSGVMWIKWYASDPARQYQYDLENHSARQV